LFLEFYRHPRAAEVYNLGGGRRNSLSILETIDLLTNMGFAPRYQQQAANRIGDHICYISDLTKVQSHFPGWEMEYDLPRIVNGIVERHLRTARVHPQPEMRIGIPALQIGGAKGN
jgi:CDP-paratose 2-epimerase